MASADAGSVSEDYSHAATEHVQLQQSDIPSLIGPPEPFAMVSAATDPSAAASVSTDHSHAATEHVLLQQSDILSLIGRKCPRSSAELHSEARNLLNKMIARFGRVPAAEPRRIHLTTDEWPHWRNYLAAHTQSARIIGDGVIDVTVEEIKGVPDPNRGGKLRVDFIIYNRNGDYWRLHPGSKPRLDAEARRFVAATATEHGAKRLASFRHQEPTIPYTWAQGQTVPQTDRVGLQRMLQFLDQLPEERPLDLTAQPLDRFPWWLWLPTVSINADLLGAGLTQIKLVHTSIAYVAFLIVRADSSGALLYAHRRPRKGSPYTVEELAAGSDKLRSFMEWKPEK